MVLGVLLFFDAGFIAIGNVNILSIFIIIFIIRGII